MFEKEAEEYASNVFNPVQEKFFITRGLVQGHIAVAFKDGAEFGYNKAKEEMQEQIEKLEKLVPKTCDNCVGYGCHAICVDCDFKDKWEIK